MELLKVTFKLPKEVQIFERTLLGAGRTCTEIDFGTLYSSHRGFCEAVPLCLAVVCCVGARKGRRAVYVKPRV